MKPLLAALLAGLVLAAPARAQDQFAAAIQALIQAWDHAQFEVTGKEAQIAALQAVQARAVQLEQLYPGAAEPLVLEAVSLCSEAGVVRGRKALGMVTRAKKILERAEKINPDALGDGSVYTNLGVLYYQVPGFPIGFGSRERARRYLERALAANPYGIDPNYFMGEFQFRQHNYAAAIAYLDRALAAPDRPGRAAADRGRRADAQALRAEAQARLR